jgi:hypothetical protein
MENLELYRQVAEVPANAKKPIAAGRLKGKTDINPMWRIEKLTEQFGPCGIGWKYVITDKRLEAGANGEISAFVDIDLYFKYEGTWSEAIPGTGGSAFVANERNGLYTSDECFKMALTDAISVSAKALGIGADVYWNENGTKYSKAKDDLIVKMETVADAAGFVITFGTHNGETLGDIWKTDGNYIDWLWGNEKTDPIIKKAINILGNAVRGGK